MSPKQPKVFADPRLTFSALSKLLAPHTPQGMMSILRDSKYPRTGPMLSYTNAEKHVVSLLTGSGSQNSILRPHEQDAVSIFIGNSFHLPTGVVAKRNNSHAAQWPFAGVEISVFPEVALSGPNGTGALKLYFGQKPLAKGVGKTMAGLIAHFRSAVLQDAATVPGYCLVYEVRTNKLHRAGARTVPPGSLAKMTSVCLMTRMLWPAV